MNLKLAAGILAIAVLAVPRIAAAQDNHHSTDDSTHTATGCLGMSSTAHTYMLTDEDGKLWDLHSKTVRLGPHVGHTVTVTGAIPKEPKNDSPANTSPQNHLLVTHIQMVRDNCKPL